jgi:hypothetical protein
MRADRGLSLTDALKIYLDRVRSCHAFEPYTILWRSAAPNEFGHSLSVLIVKEISYKNCAPQPDSTQSVRRSHLLQEAAVGGTVPGQRLSTFFCEQSSFWPHSQPEGSVLLGARTNFRSLGGARDIVSGSLLAASTSRCKFCRIWLEVSLYHVYCQKFFLVTLFYFFNGPDHLR